MYVKKKLASWNFAIGLFSVERNVTSELIKKKYVCQKDIEVSASVNKSSIQDMVFWGLLIDCIRQYSDMK
jgi:hypothetical protein